MTEKSFLEWVARLEEGVKNYTIHKNNDWLEQMQMSRGKLKDIFIEQQQEIKELIEAKDHMGKQAQAYCKHWDITKEKLAKAQQEIEKLKNENFEAYHKGYKQGKFDELMDTTFGD
ncbi:hypothetical protein LIS82_08825 [Cytobacillus solani]|uniref:hypothetical protein n=1 Tax=Cytobacillus solani TaxID=1637975 RepID=UPI00207A8E75|nr:hypothetical protein [Cytobacillus solani]USK56555.1 hypothetical protein LIS82_08825 [Cytobacillus solani]